MASTQSEVRASPERFRGGTTMHRVTTSLSALALSASSAAFAQSETPPPAESDEELFSMQEVVVTGTASKDRTKYDSSVAISTFNAEEIAQQAPKSTADVISAVPGFWVESTAGTTQGNVFARGIIQDGGYRYVALMEDGIPLYPVSELSFYNPDQFVRVDETLDRVEAIRGGTAPIFTMGAVGGAINFVTRTPGDTPQGDLKVTVSDYGLYSGDGYWATKFSNDWGLMVGGYYRQSDGIRDPGYTADKGGQFRAQLTGQFATSGTFELFGKYIDDRSLFVVPIPLEGDPSDPHAVNGGDAGTYALQSEDLRAAGLPVSAREVGLQGSDLADGIHPTLGTIGLRLTWSFTDNLTLINLTRYTNGDVRFDGIFPGDPPVSGAQFAATRGVLPSYTVIDSGAAYAPTQLVQNHGHWVIGKHYHAVQDDLRLNLSQGPHDVTFGLYFADYSMSDRWSLGNLLLMDVNDQPNRLLLPGVTDPSGFTLYSNFNLVADYDANAYSAFVSDEWKVTESLRFDFGVRYDKQETDASISNATNVDLDGNPATTYDLASQVGTNPFTQRRVDFDNTGYSVGVNYELVPRQHALFGHFTRSAKLPHFDDIRGGSLRKDGVKNIEVGYKTSLPTVALFATLFQTEFDNVFFNDILATGATVGRSAKTRTRGVELEGVLQPMDALTVRFSITQQDPKYRDFTGAVLDNTGNVIRRIPKTMVRLTPTYVFAGNRGRVYATYTHVGKRFANDENTITLPKYDKLDAGVSFDVNPSLTLQIVGDNLTDEVGLTEGNPRTDLGAGGVGAIYLARPLFGRSFLASATARF
jgi:iron complex outermembrane recepter protein